MTYQESSSSVLIAYANSENTKTIFDTLTDKAYKLRSTLRYNSLHDLPISEAAKAEYEAAKNAANDALVARSRSEMILDICRDNARSAWIFEKLSAFVDMLGTIAGKKYGPKTAQKFDAAIRADLECQVTFCDKYGHGYAEFSPLNPADRRIIGGNAICVSVSSEILPGNVVTPAPLDQWKVLYLPEPVADPEKRADAIIAAHKEVLSAYESFKRIVETYNDLLPTASTTRIEAGFFHESSMYKFHGLRTA